MNAHTADEPDLELVERRRPPNADRYSWTPFTPSENFNGHWWNRTPFMNDSPWFIAVLRQREEVARVELDDEVSFDHYTDTPTLGSRALEIQLLEVSTAHRGQGIGTMVVQALRYRYTCRRLVAFSEQADRFWSSLGWSRYDHPEGPSSYRALFIDEAVRNR